MRLRRFRRRMALLGLFMGTAGVLELPATLPGLRLGREDSSANSARWWLHPASLWAQAPLKPEEQAALVINAGNKAFNEKQYNVAADRFREYIQKFGNQKDATAARYGLGLTLLETNPRDYKSAIEALTQAAGVNEFVDRPQVLYQLAVAHRGSGFDLWQQAIAKPNEAVALKQQAQQQFAQASARFGEATAAFTARAKNPPAAPVAAPATPPAAAPVPAPGTLAVDLEWANRARCDQAEMLLRQEKSKEAAELLAPWLVDATQAKSAYRSLGLYLHGQAALALRDYAGSLRSLAALAPFTHPVFGAHAQYLLGRTHHLLEERVEAGARYDAVIAGYEKAKAAAQQQLQNGAALANQPEERARLEAFVRTPPDYVIRSQFHSAVLLQEQQKSGDALVKLTAFLQQQPQSPLADEAKLRQAMAQVELRQFPAAVQTLNALANHPLLADRALLWLGRATVSGADPAQAQPYAQALTTAIGQFTQAAEKANQRIAQEPEAKQRRGEILMELGDLQVQTRQFAAAATTFETGAKENITPLRNEEFLQRRATALHMAGQFDTSDQVCAQFAQAFPTSTLLPAVQFRAAENAFMRAAAIEPAQVPAKNPDLAKWLGEAANRYKALLEKYPEFPYASVARYRWAMTFYRQDNFAEALKLLQAIPSGDYQGELATAPYFHADCLLRAAPMDGTDALAVGRQLQALTDALKLLETFVGSQPADGKLALPQTADALLKLAYCQQKMAVQLADPAERTNRLNTARQALERITTQFPTSAAVPAAILERANCSIDLNDTGTALTELSKFKQDPLKSAAVAPLAFVRLATLLRSQNKAAEAATLLADGRNSYEAALANDASRAAWAPLLAYHHALAVKDTGKLVDAQKLFEAVSQKYATSAEAADAAWRSGQCRREDAVARLQLAIAAAQKPGAKPEEVAAANQQRTDCLKQLTETATFLTQQASAVASKAAGSETHQRLIYETAWCYQTLADQEIEVARVKLNQELLKKFQEEQAKAAAKPAATGASAVGVGPLVPPPQPPEVALSAIPKQPAEEALRAQYTALIAAGVDSPLALLARLELAEALSKRGEDDPAIALLDEALTLEPSPEIEEKLRLRLGSCLLTKNTPDKALPQFVAVASNAKSTLAPEARYRAGECQLMLKDFAKAIELLTPFRDQQPLQNIPQLSERALLRLGHAHALAGAWDPSRQTLEQLLQRFPQSPLRFEARYAIGWSYQSQKQYDPAAAAYQLVINETATEVAAKAQYQLALCRLEQKRLPEAINALLVVPFTYDYPEWNAISLLEAARIFQDLNQPPQARRLLERVVKEFPNTDWAKTAQQRLTQLQTGANP